MNNIMYIFILIIITIISISKVLKHNKKNKIVPIIIIIISVFLIYHNKTDIKKLQDNISSVKNNEIITTKEVNNTSFDLENVPEYKDSPYVVINNNIPFFEDKDLTTKSYEKYSDLDNLGRCGVAVSVVGKDLMPTEKRGSISGIKPTGWHTTKYPGIDGSYLYNRCHLIGYQLTGENANKKNLVTCTRYLNVTGMLPFENMVTDYVKETNKHVIYRVTPIFEGDNLVISGVLMEAKSVEDNGKSIEFNIYAYNVQPGITIDYKTGDSYKK